MSGRQRRESRQAPATAFSSKWHSRLLATINAALVWLALAANVNGLVILPLDEGSGVVALDSSGLDNHGSLLGNPVYAATSGDGSAHSLRFDGANDSIDLGNLDVAGAGLTLAAWFNADSFPGRYRDPRLISKASGTAADQHVFMLSTIRAGTATRLRARVRIGGTTSTLIASGGNLATGDWYHGALTYDGSTLRLYLNGIEVGSQPLAGTVDVEPNLAVAVGSQPGATERLFDGLIDHVQILERALSPSELAAIVVGNGPPEAANDTYPLDEDTPLSVTAGQGVLANDTDPENDPLQAVLVNGVSYGSLVLNNDGAFDYIPTGNYAGADSFSYRANDASGSSNLATVTLTIGAIGDAPIAVDEGYQTTPNQPLAIAAANGVLANDTDVDSTGLQAILVDDAGQGSLVLNADGSFNYTPDLNYSGEDSFTYQANDGDLESNSATVTIVIAAPPLAVDDSYQLTEDDPLVVPAAAGLLANDSDSSPPADLFVELVTPPSHGSLSNFGADGSFTYLPIENYFGEDSFVYRVLDGIDRTSAEGTVTLDIAAANDAPVAMDDNYEVQADAALVVTPLEGVLANDTDTDGDTLQGAVLADPVNHGTLQLNADGSFSYSPVAGFSGEDSFTYRADDGSDTSNLATVLIQVQPEVTMVAGALVQLGLNEGSGVVALDSSGLDNHGTLLGNPVYEANSGDGSAYSLRFDGIDDSIDLGNLDVAGSGLTLAAWFNADSFPGNYRDPRLISKATGTAGNDHWFMLGMIQRGAETRLRARIKIGGTTTTLVATTGNLAIGQWQHAAATYDGAQLRLYLDGVVVGSTALTGAIDTDPQVSVAVGSQPGGTKRLFDGLIDHAQILERALSPAELAVIVAGNGPPEATNDAYAVDEDTPLSVTASLGVLANDADPENDPLQAVLVDYVSNGSLVLNEDGAFDYTPAANYAGADSFTYRANDTASSSNIATVTLTIGAIGDAPVAVDESYQTIPNQPLTVVSANGVLANDTDVDSTGLQAILVGDASQGTLALNPDGSFNYTPNLNYIGEDSFTYQASDGDLESNLATVTIVIASPPLAVDDSYNLTEDVLLVVPAINGVLLNDGDTNPPDDLTVLLASGPSHGELTQLGADGSFSYLPNANYHGEDSFTYRVLDGVNGTGATATVTLIVQAANDVPQAADDIYTTLVNTPLSVAENEGLLSNDTDVDGDTIQNALVVDDVEHGSLLLSEDGSFEYIPATDYQGADGFTYRAGDGTGDTNIASVAIDIRPEFTAFSGTIVQLALDEGSGAVALDSSGLGHDGVLEGNAVYSTDTADGSSYALRLDGVDDHINLGSLDVAGTGLTLAAWFNADSFPGNYRDPRLISKATGTAGNDHWFMLGMIRRGDAATRLRVRVKVGGTTTTLVASTGNLATGQWHHGAATYDGAQLRLYLDGTLVGSTALAGAVDIAPEVPVAVGSHPGGTKRLFDGLVDDVRILDRALSQEEIATLLAIDPSGDPPTASFSANPVVGEAPLPVTFDASASSATNGELVSYAWDFGDGTTGSGQSVDHVFSEIGSYTVNVVVTDGQGLQDQSSRVIQANSTTGDTGPAAFWRRLSVSTGDIPAPTSDAPDQTVALVFDISGDGINDFVIGSRRSTSGPSLEWWHYVEGQWDRYVIEPDLLPLEAGGTFYDIDGDGDLDLVVGEDFSGDRLYWWENPSPDFSNRWVRREIKNAAGRQHHDQMFGDFDGDGLAELVFWNNRADNSLWIADIPADPTVEPWPATLIYNGTDKSEGLFAADIDVDGLTDIVGGGYWFKYDNAGGYIANPIDPALTFIRVVAGQFIEGGRPEVVFDSGDTIGDLRLYHWNGTAWVGRDLLGAESEYGHSLNAGDINGDGKLDLVSAEMLLGTTLQPRLRILYGDGDGNFATEILAVGIGNHESKLADLDGDGDLDILGKPFQQDVPQINIWLNEGDRLGLDSWQRHVLDGDVPYRTIMVEHGDLDGDGLEDIATGGWWWKNPGHATRSWTRFAIGSPLNQVASLYDFDADGDLDILGTAGTGSQSNSSLHWASNDGSGNFTIHSNIAASVGDFLQGVTVAQFSPGVTEIGLTWHDKAGGIQLITVPPPQDVTTATWTLREVSPSGSGEALDHGDIDNDGNLDLFDGDAWYRNEGTGLFTRYQLVGVVSGAPDRNLLADMDNDGDLDAVIGFEGDPQGKVSWFEQGLDPAQLWLQHPIDTVGPANVHSLDVADLDGDGLNEVIVGEHSNPAIAGLKLQVYRQRADGSWQPNLVYAGDEHHDGAQVFDADNDGDLDIVSIGWLHRRLVLYENNAIEAPLPPPGQPGQLSAVPMGAARIDLYWNPSINGAGSIVYKIYRNSTLVATVTQTNWTDGDVVPGNTYVYDVVATDADGNSSTAASLSTRALTLDNANWWHPDWPYRLHISVGTGEFERVARVAELSINFSQIFAGLAETAAFNAATMRCHEVGVDGAMIAADIPCQFDLAADYDAQTNAMGNLVTLLSGVTTERAARYLHVYFDVAEGSSTPATVQTPQVTIDTDTLDEGQTSYRITTSSGEYFYQQEAGGFSSLHDIQGNDWIDYHPTGGEAGNFRGIPNLVYPEGKFHPGSISATTTLVDSGPLKTTLESTDGLWKVRWEFYAHTATMTLLAAEKDYWFLYEGTPGGALETDTDYLVTSNGTLNLTSQSWVADLPADEWVYFADPALERSLFLAHLEDDQAIDSYRPLQGQMTVFGFGREGLQSSISQVPAQFTIGLMETTDYAAAKRLINSAIKPVEVLLNGAQVAP